MDNFLSLPEEKRKIIIDAALKSFGTNGYKKTSISDIANAAGISKAMVFHYFGTKKTLYFYLVDLCGSIIMNEVKEKFDYTITDFFDRIRLSSSIEISVVKRHPAILAFLASVYFETDNEVKDDLKAIFSTSGEEFRNKIAFDGVDYTKFKEGIDLKLLMKMLLWMTDGYTKELTNKGHLDFDEMLNEFDEAMELLKNNLYKKEFL